MSDSSTDDSVIEYRFFFNNKRVGEHKVYLRPIEPTDRKEAVPAEWTRLDFHKCRHCPLSSDSSPQCPFAAALVEPVNMLADIASFEAVDVVVTWRGREIRQSTTVQRAAGSLLGAISATSGCPHTARFKAMAWFHWPFSTSHETIYRSLGTYLLAQYLRGQRGLEADWELNGLRELYRHLRLVNLGMAERLRAAADVDSSVNGIILLDLLAADTLYSLDQYEGELDTYFEEHLR
ncbi:MAG: hypothetical protein K0S16_301 [Moraxellaceae bacterium]|jgi:hypothetical protein|nr:hypothetical protein [Moraxellaceae bacterium]